MSLLSDAMTDCVYVNKSIVDDGYGGYRTEWTDGATIKCAIVKDTSIQGKIAEKQGVTDLVTITTSRGINLQFHDVVKRLSDGKIFRVTSNGDDKKTPLSAGIDMRQVSAEEWDLTNG